MIVNERFELSFKHTYQKVLYLALAQKDTFAMLVDLSPGRNALVHVDSKGKIINEQMLQHLVDSFAMPSPREVVIANPQQNFLIVYELWDRHRVRPIPHNFRVRDLDQCKVDCFSDTGYICVREWGRYNEHCLHLNYYEHPLRKQSRPFATYESRQMQWTYEMAVNKANQHSMYVWYRRRCDEEIDIKVFDLRMNRRGVLNEIRIRNTIGQIYNLPKTYCTIFNAYEFKPGLLMVNCSSNKLVCDALNKKKVANDNYVLDIKYRSIREAAFCFEPFENQRVSLIHNLGSFSVFYTYKVDQETHMMAQSPVYFVDHRRQRLFAKQKWVCSSSYKFSQPGWSRNLFIENQYENGDVKSAVVTKKRVWERKEVFLHLLLHLNPDFHHTLLEDALELLDRS